jgi:hypothetical protein
MHRISPALWVALAFSIVGPALASAAPQVRVPDPSWSMPKPLHAFDVDPYETNNSFGPMYAPKGKLSCVTWYESGFGGHGDDPPNWHKRVTQRFDDANKCVEIETWWMGELESRERFCAATANDTAHQLYWGYREMDCGRLDAVVDDTGRLAAVLLTPMESDGKRPSGGTQRLSQGCEYDLQGKLAQSTSFAPDGSVWYFVRWSYDAAGRIAEVRYEYTHWTRRLEYDTRSRVIRAWTLKDHSPSIERLEFQFDENDRLLASRDIIDGETTEFAQYTYSPGGKLIARQTSHTWRDEFRGGDCVEETFDGIDRPMSRDIYDEHGKLRYLSRWAYENDSRGNWVLQLESLVAGWPPGPVTWRKIEYAE